MPSYLSEGIKDDNKRIQENIGIKSGETMQLISRIEKQLSNDLNLDNILKKLEEKNISFSKEETKRVTEKLGLNLQENQLQDLQQHIDQSSKNDVEVNKDDER